MNIRNVIQQLGKLTFLLAVAILAVSSWSAFDWLRGDTLEREASMALWITLGISIVIGVICRYVSRCNDQFMGRREALLLVAMSWLAGAAIAGLPFWIWTLITGNSEHPFSSFVSCYFEAMSGLTTTGASVLSNIEVMPKGLLLWRATTHWLGGLGIVVLFVAVLPGLGVGGKKLFQIEAPGPTQQGVRPQIRETARVLWLIYLSLTIAEIVLLRAAGMDWFTSVCHTFATLATGGFSTYNASAAALTPMMQWVIIIFMVLAGVNFGMYYHLIRRRLDNVLTDPEFRLYLGIMVVASVFIAVFLITANYHLQEGASIASVARDSIFQVVSIQTTTGFCSTDFNQWPFFTKAVIMALMFIGASAGSTGGGIKVIRIIIAFKVIVAEIERIFRPNVVRTIKVGSAPVDPEMRLAALVYIISILALFVIGALLLMGFEGNDIDFTTAASASAATLNNIGPGFAKVGAVENYGFFSAPSKIVMSLLMVLGRLEMYAILVLFVPRFWRDD